MANLFALVQLVEPNMIPLWLSLLSISRQLIAYNLSLMYAKKNKQFGAEANTHNESEEEIYGQAGNNFIFSRGVPRIN